MLDFLSPQGFAQSGCTLGFNICHRWRPLAILSRPPRDGDGGGEFEEEEAFFVEVDAREEDRAFGV